MPSRQWYLSAKQPPGQRTTTGPSRLTWSMIAWRMPSVLAIFESGPTQMPS